MKKFILSASVIGVFVIYSIHLKLGGNENPSVAVKTSPSTLQIKTAPSGGYKNGTYTGNVADAFYGNIQVQVTISGGKISNVIFLQFPNDRTTSQMINAQADPILAQEAIQAQSAQVSGVTGATQSSGAFVQSMQSALQQTI